MFKLLFEAMLLTQTSGLEVFRAYDAIRQVTQSPEADLQMPDLVRTSKMRKYMATMLQVGLFFNLDTLNYFFMYLLKSIKTMPVFDKPEKYINCYVIQIFILALRISNEHDTHDTQDVDPS